ncbi:hypothetical protein V8D89_001331 [Ganoderma adspersum]
MAEDTLPARSPPELPIEVWQLVMDSVWDATNYSTFYTNQADYRSWALVSRAWRTCAQAVLFRTVELPDATHLQRFTALLGVAPHLAVYVRTLRAYSRDLHTPDNVVALLPAILDRSGLPSLRSLLVTRVTEQDTWHPHAARAPSDKELAYMPLDPSPGPNTDRDSTTGFSGFWKGLEAHFAGVSELYLSYVTFETFGALAQTLHALRNLRLLSCLEVRWCALGPMPECLAGKGEGAGEGEGRGQGQGQGTSTFLPKLEDLTIAYMDLHGVERLLSALGRSARLKGLYIDCPHYSPASFWDPPSGDPATGTPLGIDLRAFARLGSLWLALPYTLAACRDLPELVAALLRTWTPTEASVPRKLTLTPSYESDFTRAEFADVLRALGPVIEDVFGEGRLDPEGEGEEEKVEPGEGERPGLAEVEVCVVDKADMREWWREEARASFARLGARGRLDVSFEKGFWPEAQWLDDEVHPEEALAIAQHALDGVSAEAHGTGDWSGFRDSVIEGRASDSVARRRRGSSRFTRFRPPNLKPFEAQATPLVEEEETAWDLAARGVCWLIVSRLAWG